MALQDSMLIVQKVEADDLVDLGSAPMIMKLSA